MKWFEFLRNARESTDYEGYIIDHWKEADDKDIWLKICAEPLQMSFIEKCKDLVNWKAVCRYSQLTETFIEDHIDKIDWRSVSANQNLSLDFVKKHKYQLDWNTLMSRFRYPEEFLLELINDDHIDLDIGVALSNQSFTKENVEMLSKRYRSLEISKSIKN